MSQRKNQYQSYHTLSPREYMYFPRGTIQMGKPGQFSRLELKHLLTAIFVLTIAFSFALTQSSVFMLFFFNRGFDISRLSFGLVLSFLGVLFAFIIHELAHKFMAQKYGLWSEFRMYTKGLLTSLFLSIFTGFVLAAPGAVMFRGEPRDFEQARIAVAGPSANITLAGILFIIYTVFFMQSSSTISVAIGFIFVINAILGFFNILPLGPLDGVIIYKWNKSLWFALFISSCVLISLIFRIIPRLLIY